MLEPKHPRWIVAGHPSSNPHQLADELLLDQACVLVVDGSTEDSTDLNSCDAFLMAISAKTGVSAQMIELWEHFADRQIPRMIVVNGLEFSETDFDDIVLIANRVLENVITPYLVLHDDLGEPSGLISLSDNLVYDYSAEDPRSYPADDELTSIVSEFRDEFILATSEMDRSAYSQGLLVPAIPYVASKQMGKSQIQYFASLLTTH